MGLILTLVIVFALYLFLIAPRMMGKPDRSMLYGVHYAHRGLFDNDTEAPENSLAAIKKAVDAGYGIEFDIQLTKDDIPVVFHDASLKRMCGAEGKIWEYTFEELQQFKLANSEEKIPTFEKVLETVGGRVPLIIEYKMDRVDTKVCVLGDEILKKYQGPYCIESFHPFAVQWYKKNRPEVVRGQLSEEFWKGNTGKTEGILYIVGNLLTNFLCRPDFIAYRHSDAGNISRRLCKLMGALSVTYTIKSLEEYEKAKKHYELFIFDNCRL